MLTAMAKPTRTPVAAPPPHIVILAAGAGKRMKLEHPKALYPVFFRPMIHYALDAAMALPHRSVSLVVGRGEREFREQCRGYHELRIVRQGAPSGTADALLAAESALTEDGDVLIICGDAVLLSAPTLQELLAKHAETGAGGTVGKPERDGEPVACCFRVRDLFSVLKRGGTRGSGEFTLADAASALAAGGAATVEYRFADPVETLDINDFHGLWRVETVLQERFNRELMLGGVALQDPRTTLIDPRCRIDRDVRIEGGCTVINSVLESGVRLENFCRIVDSEIGPGSRLLQGTCAEKARVGRGCRVGPYARLRPGAQLQDDVWIGNFVEIENASLGSGTRAAHQCYIADAQVGRNVSIGCGFITCNSGGRPLKQRTIIEDDVFIGSASQTIAPVTLGAGCFIATGTSVTEDAPPDSFVISRTRQVTKPGYAKKYEKTKGRGAAR